MKIIIFGGSFDPIHQQHEAIMQEAYSKLKADVLLVVLAHHSPLKKRKLTADISRFKMVKKITDKYSWMKVETCELNRKGISYTIDTVQYLKHKYGQEHQYYLIIGSDQANNLSQWKNINLLKELVTFVVAQRKGYVLNTAQLKAYNFIILKPVFLNVNSTKIREGLDLHYLQPEILKYINNNGLYVKERLMFNMNDERFNHCLNVGTMAKDLAIHYGVNDRKAWIAGVYHDVTKQWNKAKQEQYLLQYLPKVLTEPYPTWHSYTAALYLKNDLKLTDKEILSAISKHTTGNTNMSKLDKIIFIADKISSERNYLGVEHLRKLAFQNLEKAFLEVFKMHYKQVIDNNKISDVGQQIIKTQQKFIK